MNQPHIRMRVLCAAAAVLLTGLSSTVFVSAAPRDLERRITARSLALQLDRAQVESLRTAVALESATNSPAG
jgi:hypothetical protein